MNQIKIINIDEKIAKEAGHIRYELASKDIIIGQHDILIGATACYHNIIMVTSNIREFERIAINRKLERKMKSAALTLAIIFMCPSKGFANESFYKDKARRWHWYEKKAKDDLNKQANHSEMMPTEQVKSIRKDAEEKLHKAMINQTQENIKTFIKAQKAIGDSSEKFSQVWMQVIYNNSELDPSIKNPTSEKALRIARAEGSQKKREQVKALSQEYGLLYFFKGNDQMCREFNSVVKRFLFIL